MCNCRRSLRSLIGKNIYLTDIINSNFKKDITILHCISNYPAKIKNVNLKNLIKIKKLFGFPVGFSDHTIGNECAIASVALGSKIIEKHVTFDKNSKKFLNSNKIPFVLMHSISTPEKMQKNIKYKDVLLDIYDFFEKQISLCEKNGISKSRIIIDPGIGFGKTLQQNLKLISNIALFHSLGLPVLLGSSRKSFIGKIEKNELYEDRLGGSIATVMHGLAEGVQIFRVHDVYATKQSIKVYSKIK